jgi:hypothetical protein
VPEGQLVVALDEQVGGDQLTHRGEDLGRRRAERSRQLVERERPPQRGGDGHHRSRGLGQPPHPLAHPVLHTARHAPVHEFRPAALDTDAMLVAQAEQELHDQKRTAAGVVQETANVVVGLAAEHLTRQPVYGIGVERAQRHSGRAASLQLIECPCHRRGSSRRAQGDDPGDRQAGEPDRQRAKGGGGAAVGPVHIVDRDHDRTLERGPFQEALQVS